MYYYPQNYPQKCEIIRVNGRNGGVYMVSVDATAAASTTLQITKDGTALPQAQSTGTTPSFVTLIQVDRNNSCCACSSPVVLRLVNSVATTLTDCNIVVTKVV